MLDQKNLPVIEAVAEVLSETRTALNAAIEKNAGDLVAIQAKIVEVEARASESHSDLASEMLRVVKESAEENKTIAQERVVKLTKEFNSSIASSVKKIDAKHDEINSKIDQLSSDVLTKIKESTDIQRKALDAATESTLGQLTESVQKTSEVINAYSKTIIDVEQRQGKAEELTHQVKTQVKTHFETLRSIVDERLALIKDGQNGIDGKDGRDGLDGKDAPVITKTEIVESILSDNEFISAIQGKDGVDGLNGKDGRDGLDGKDAPVITKTEIVESILSDNEFISAIQGKDGVDGLNGKDGRDGEPGRDIPIIEPMLVRDGDKVDKNTLVAHGGGLFMTSRKANGSPVDDPAGYNCIVNGIDDISFEQTELRKTAMRLALSDGLVIDHIIINHSPVFRGTFKKEVEYSINDIVIKDRKTLIKVAEDGDKQWQMFVFTDKGEQGEAGKSGDQGLPGVDGVGIKDIFASDSNILFEMTDGRIHTIELALPDLHGDFDGATVKSFRGYYDANQTYSAGEIVRMDNSLWLAVDRTTDIPSGKSAAWVQMIAGSVGGSGGGGGDGTVGPQGPRGPQGVPGKPGANGKPGADGAQGPQGEQGIQGELGPTAVSLDPDNAAILSPTDGLIYVPKSTSSSVTVSAVPPVDDQENSLWFNTNNGGLYVLYNDGSSIQWVQTTSAPGAATMYASETPPADPTKNQLWFNSQTASMFVYYLDSTGGQWVEIVSISAAPEIIQLQTEIATLKKQVADLVALIQK